MKWIYLYIMFLLIETNLFCQSIESVKKYLYWIDSAENSFCSQQYSKADSLYREAFDQKVYIHTLDLYNACQSALLCENFRSASAYMDSMVLRGFSLNHFMGAYAFKPFRGTTFWTDFISRYPELQRQFRHRINWELRTLIETMFVKDQYLALDGPEYDRRLREELFYENIKIISSEIIQNGFPTDAKIGVFFNKSDTLYEAFSPVDLMIFHVYQKGDFRLTPIFKKSVENGYVKPDFFMLCHDYELNIGHGNNLGYGIYPYCYLNDTLYQKEYPPDVLEKINENRQSVLGSSYNSLARKGEFFVLNKSVSWRFKTVLGITLKMNATFATKKGRELYLKAEYLKLVDHDFNTERKE